MKRIALGTWLLAFLFSVLALSGCQAAQEADPAAPKTTTSSATGDGATSGTTVSPATTASQTTTSIVTGGGTTSIVTESPVTTASRTTTSIVTGGGTTSIVTEKPAGSTAAGTTASSQYEMGDVEIDVDDLLGGEETTTASSYDEISGWSPVMP